MKKLILSLALATLTSSAALADKDYYAPIKDKVTKAECGACHMAFPAGLLPATSWKKIMQGLSDHFGEDASLDPKTNKHITSYFMKHSEKGRFRNPAQRITELRWFVKEHRDHEVSQRAKKRAGTMSNCKACHRGADRGNFDDD